MFQPGGKLREGKGLTPQLIGIYEDDFEWVGYFDFGRPS
jgi:hypothetical protein